MSWQNSDGLYVKFGGEEGKIAVGGEAAPASDLYVITWVTDYTELLTATPTILDGSSSTSLVGPFGIEVPEGARPRSLEIMTITAPTSSGTVASATISIGTKKASDRSTELDHDDFTTSSLVIGTVLESAGEVVTIIPGSTGAGNGFNTIYAENGVIVGCNTAHASHPFTAGRWQFKLTYEYARTYE